MLYYESIGLLKPARRGAGNYRSYSDRDAERIQQICTYRNAGLSLDDIRTILEHPESGSSAILKRRIVELDAEIEIRRKHQRAILMLLQDKNSFRRTKMMTKEKWVRIMKSAGFSDDDMHRGTSSSNGQRRMTTRNFCNRSISSRRRLPAFANGAGTPSCRRVSLLSL